MKTGVREIEDRVRELQTRPEAFKALRDILNRSSYFLLGIKNMTGKGEQFVFTEGEFTSFAKLINETKVCSKIVITFVLSFV